MNKKLIAVAVSATLMAPVVAQADVTVYGRINNAIDIKDVDNGATNTSTTDISGVSSRFGVKASSDLGNGLTASGRYELSMTTDKETNAAGGAGTNDVRIAQVGLSGGFGSVTVGQQWSAFYNTVGTHIDPTVSLGYYLYSSIVGGVYRTSNTIKYANSFGPVSLELDVRMNESDEGADVAEKINGDGFGLGLSMTPVDGLTVAVAMDTEDGVAGDANNGADVDRSGVVLKYDMGSFWGSVGWHETSAGTSDISQTQLWLGTSFDATSVMVGYGTVENNVNTVEPSALVLNATHNFGGGFKLYYEGIALDMDVANGTGDTDRHYLGMRYDF